MMDDLYEKFLPQFVDLARVRLERALETIARSDPNAMTAVIRELHAIAGEAGLLGLGPIMGLARQAEDLAKRLRDSSATDASPLVAALEELKQALERVGPKNKPGGGA
ncbi:MAG TPA: Hpt domain-containing protein [Kofleriaceae bacterium]|nr:Hpt domain-containing protein [Kofleriaceae bacterium]